MKVVTELPKSGQFIAVWEFQGSICCDTYRYNNNGVLELYNMGDEDKEEYWTTEFGGLVDDIYNEIYILFQRRLYELSNYHVPIHLLLRVIF